MESEELANNPTDTNEKPASVPSALVAAKAPLVPQQNAQPLSTIGREKSSMASSNYVYALGRIQPRFPSLGVEKEFVQATRGGEAVRNRDETRVDDMTGLTNQQAVHDVLKQQRYLARQLCWVLTIEGLETYILVPRDSADVALLVEALRPYPSPMDLDVVIGLLGPIAPPQMCNGLMVPIVMFDQIYSFDRDSLLASIPRIDNVPEDRFKPVAEELLDQILQTADNAGVMDEHRALNYLAVRYHVIYKTAAEAYGRGSSLTAVEVRPSRLSGTRKIVDVIFSYTNRDTDGVEKFFARVDVTEEFPFLVTKMSTFYER